MADRVDHVRGRCFRSSVLLPRHGGGGATGAAMGASGFIIIELLELLDIVAVAGGARDTVT